MEAGIGVPFVIICPACGVTQSAANASSIVKKYLLDDLGREKMKTTKCQACTKMIAVLVKSVKYRVL
jgi:predicted RNA-binding Zn-ribbon protein involved in translation (DUF1610 family)